MTALVGDKEEGRGDLLLGSLATGEGEERTVELLSIGERGERACFPGKRSFHPRLPRGVGPRRPSRSGP